MWIKNIRQRKLQSVMIFLIIMICTILLTGSMNILGSLDKPCRDFAKTSNSVTLKVSPYTNNEDEVYAMGEQYEKFSNVAKVEFVRSHTVEETILFNNKKTDIFPRLTEYNNYVNGGAVYLEGNKDTGKTLADNECIIPTCISNEYQLHNGDFVTVQLSNGDVTYKVVAVYGDAYQTNISFDCDILIKKLPEIKNSLRIYVYGKDDVTGKQIDEEFREKYNGNINIDTFSLEDRIDHGLLVGRIIGAVFLAVGIIMLLVSGLMIHYMIQNTMYVDAKSIAVFKTMGYTSNDILFMYLKLYFALATLACMVGIISSVFVSNNILTSIFKNMGKLQVDNYYLSGAISYFVIVGFVIFVITVIITKTKKIKPVHSLNGMDFGGVKKKKNYKGNSSFQFSAMGIAYRTFSREKRNTISIIITCIVTIFSINFIVISLDAANTMKENNDYWLGIDKSDVMINVTEPALYKDVKSIVQKDKRTDYCLDSIYLVDITMKWKKGMDTTNMSAFVYDDFDQVKLPVTKGRNPKDFNEIAISTAMAESLHKNIGDYLEIYLQGEKKADMLITGLFQTYMQFGNMCRLTTSAFTEHNYEIYYNNISIYLKNSKDTDQFIKELKASIGGKSNIIRRTDQYGSVMDSISEPQQKAVPPVAVLIMIIAGINIFSIVYLKNVKSQKINGIYKCIGYTTWHLIRSNLCYVGAIAIVSVFITFPISLLTYAPIMKICLSMFNFSEYPMQLNMLHLFLTNVAVVVVFIISTLISSQALFKVSARDLVQE